jgi:hypothetical protein
MHSDMKISRVGDEVALLSQNGGRAMALLLALEIALLGWLLWQLSGVVGDIDAIAIPAIASAVLVVWTAAQIKPDYRLTMNLATGEGRIVRIAPLTGTSTEAVFPLIDVESMSLLQTASRHLANKARSEYVVAVELRDGHRHVFTTRGPMLAYRRAVSRFGEAAGIMTRVVRLPAA